MIATLRQRNFALLWLGGLISMIGDWVLIATLPFYIYAQTQSVLASSGFLIAYVAPQLLLSSISGVFVDRWDRKRTLVAVSLLQGGLIACLLLVRSNDWLWLVYIVAFAESALSTFARPAENALLPRLVGEDHLQPANALNAINDNLARLIGPPIGGLLLGLLGLSSVVLLDVASYLLAALLIAAVRSPERPGESAEPGAGAAEQWLQFWREWRAGMATIGGLPVLRAIFLVAGVSALGDAMVSALLVPFVSDVLQAGALGFGWLLTARGLGGLAGGALAGWLGQRIEPTRLLAGSGVAAGLLLLLAVNVPSFPSLLGLLALLGIAAVCWQISQQTVLQQQTPATFLGRVFGAFGMTTALLNLAGNAATSLAADRLGIMLLLNGAVAIMLLAGALAFVVLRPQPGPAPATEAG